MNKKDTLEFTPIATREGLDAAVAEVAALKFQLAAARSEMELEMARVQERRQGEMAILAKQIEIREAGVFTFCRAHRAQLFPGKKSIDFLMATVGFRTEPPSVQRTSRKENWSAIARRLESTDWGKRYLHTPEPELDKKALLADREKLTAEQLTQAGLRFDQPEQFYIAPKSELAPRTVLEAA